MLMKTCPRSMTKLTVKGSSSTRHRILTYKENGRRDRDEWNSLFWKKSQKHRYWRDWRREGRMGMGFLTPAQGQCEVPRASSSEKLLYIPRGLCSPWTRNLISLIPEYPDFLSFKALRSLPLGNYNPPPYHFLFFLPFWRWWEFW